MKKLGSILFAAVFLCAGCTYTIDASDPRYFTPPAITAGYNPFYGMACADEVVADGEQVASFSFTLDEKGRPQNITLLQKTNDCLAEAAEGELKQWVFSLAKFDGRPIENALYRLNFNFDSERREVTITATFDEETGAVDRIRILSVE